MLVTDAQIHVWEVDRPDRPWPQPPRNEPQLEDGFSADQAIAAMDEAGVDRAVIVPPTWIGESNVTALEAAERYPGRFGVMGRFDIDAPDARDQLARWREQPHLLGIRVTFFAKPTFAQLEDGSLEWFFDACERHDIPLMMLFGGAPEKVQPVLERHPALSVILDHMALDLTAEGEAAWASLDTTVALARYPRLHVKVSSAPNFSWEPYPHRDIHGYLGRLHEAYGARRLFWGSDYTRLRGTYRDSIRLFAEELDFLTAEDREWVLGRGLSECLGWPEQEGA
ncbi:MAG: amidohydrolase family protein [Dehalococcoidia bacterium]